MLFALLALAISLRMVNAGALLSSGANVRSVAGLLAGAAIGAKIGFMLQFPLLPLAADTQTIWMVLAGNSGPGAFAGGVLGLAVAAGARTGYVAEALLPAVLAAWLILDLGALFWALTEPGFGIATDRWGVDFGDGVGRHPVMLYDAGAMLGLLWAARATRLAGPGADVRTGMVVGACFGIWFLLGFLKPPFGPLLILEAVSPRPALYPPGLTGEQWLCLVAIGWIGAKVWRAAPISR